MHSSLVCAACGLEHSTDRLQNLCTSCRKPLLAQYDLSAIRGTFNPNDARQSRARSLWKFHQVLPVDGLQQAVSLGEGLTPLIRCQRRGPFERFERLYVKDESFNPTASFKARGMSAAITRAVALGVRSVALPSAGNAAGAAAYYAARAGLRCHVFIPEDTPPANIVEAVLANARVYLVNGLISDCGRLVQQACRRFEWFDLSTLKEPFRIEGKKTMAYELVLDLADAANTSEPVVPDVIVYPTGGGTGLIGMWKAFAEMEALGWIGSQRPRMVTVQAEGCAPIVRAFEAGLDRAEPVSNASTVASGLRVPAAIGDFLMLRALRESQGTAVTVSDAELLDGAKTLSQWQGISACPEGGAAWAAVGKLARSGWLNPKEIIVVFNTGSALKYTHLFPVGSLPTLDHHNPNCLDEIAAGFA